MLDRSGRTAGAYTRVVSTVEQPEEPRVSVRPPDDALRAARPLPPREELVVENISDDEWAAFAEALDET